MNVGQVRQVYRLIVEKSKGMFSGVVYRNVNDRHATKHIL